MSMQTIRLLIPSTRSVFRKEDREQTFANVFPLLWPRGHCRLSRFHFHSTTIFSVAQIVQEQHDHYQGQTNVSRVFVSILFFSLPSVLLFVCFNGSDWNIASPSDKNRTEWCPGKGHPHDVKKKTYDFFSFSLPVCIHYNFYI